jgi:hypothetical protein
VDETKDMRLKGLPIKIAIVLGIVLVCIVAFLRSPLYRVLDSMYDPDPFDDRSFNQRVWLKHYDDWSWDNPRGPMAGSVRDLLVETRMTREEVIELLGPPEISEGDYAVRYLLGPWRGIPIDDDFLVVYFDEDGRVKDVRIMGS